MILTMFYHCFVIHCSSKRGIKICQALERVCFALIAWWGNCTVHGGIPMPMPQLIHTNRKASPSSGNEWMDNHLLKRKVLRQLIGAMAIHILSLISAISLYCV